MTAAVVKAGSLQVRTSAEYFSDTLIDEFIASRHSSPNTAKSYRNACRQMLKFFAAKGIVAPMTADVDSFFNSLRAGKKTVATIRLYSTVTKLYFAFLEKKGVYRDVAAETEPLKLRKSTTHAKRALSPAQAQKMLAVVGKGDSLIARRDKAIVALALQTGVRTIEIERAKRGDFTPNEDGEGYLLAVTGKGHSTADATVRVAPAVADLILSYLEARGEVANDAPLFASTSRNNSKYGARFSAQSVQKLIKRVMVEAGIRSRDEKTDVNKKIITPHSCRHFAATTAIKAGVDIREVAAMLRHTSVNITATYLHDMQATTRRAEMAVAESLFGGAA